MAAMVTPDAIKLILADSSSNSSSSEPEVIVQVTDLKPLSGDKHRFLANDGKLKVKAVLGSRLSLDVRSGKIKDFVLIRLIEYSVSTNRSEKVLVVTNCELVSCALQSEYKVDESAMLVDPTEEVSKSGSRNGACDTAVKPKQEIVHTFAAPESAQSGMMVESTGEVSKSEIRNGAHGTIVKPKQEFVAKSADQVYEQIINQAPAARLSMTRRVQPLVSLNPYQGKWTIKVRVTSKGEMRSYNNSKGKGHVFNVELTDEDGTQIQATMFNKAAEKFNEIFKMGNVYYVSNGSLKVANKQYKTVHNDYELTLTEYSVVEEVIEEKAFIPKTIFNFRKIDELGPYVNRRELVDVIGVIKSVSPTMSIRRKSDNEQVAKRDITIADQTEKLVSVSLWGDLATKVGQELLDMAQDSPIVAIKSLKVGDYQGISLSTVSKSTIVVNPDSEEATELRSWFDTVGKEASMTSISSSPQGGAQSMYADRVNLIRITDDESLGEKMVFFSIKAYISSINPEQTMWYLACKKCSKRVLEDSFRCDNCSMENPETSLRYIMNAKITDTTSEAYVSIFNDQAHKIIGCSADELNELKSKDAIEFGSKLKDVAWEPFLFRVAVTQNVYKEQTRQRITVRAVESIDKPENRGKEDKFMAEEISKMTEEIKMMI